MVTGVLPISLNKACKLSNFFMHHDKEYTGEMQLHKGLNEKKLKLEMNKFIGTISQLPPQKSSVKRQLRKRTINKFELVGLKGKIAKFHCDVEAGTYIRKLIHDLGENLNGAHMASLRRIRAGIFIEKNSVKIEEVDLAFKLWEEKGDEKKLRKILIPAEIISEICPIVFCKSDKELIKQLLNGKPIYLEDIKGSLPKEDIFSLFNKQIFIGMYKKVDKEKIIAKSMFVFN